MINLDKNYSKKRSNLNSGFSNTFLRATKYTFHQNTTLRKQWKGGLKILVIPEVNVKKSFYITIYLSLIYIYIYIYNMFPHPKLLIVTYDETSHIGPNDINYFIYLLAASMVAFSQK